MTDLNSLIHDYYRYVDDSRNALPCLKEGWRWTHDRFEFSDDWEAEDLNSGVTDQHRTMVEITKAMSSLVSFLCFEGEESGMYPDQKLPTLDTAIWYEEGRFRHQFFEKKMCPNRVLQKDTALSPYSVRASLNQEVVRRLLLCSRDSDLYIGKVTSTTLQGNKPINLVKFWT